MQDDWGGAQRALDHAAMSPLSLEMHSQCAASRQLAKIAYMRSTLLICE
jgi:hypothetical protein